MRRRISYHIILFMITGIFLSCCGDWKQKQWQWLDSLPKPWMLSEAEVSEILPQFRIRFPGFQNRLKAFAVWRVGTPYEIFKLGEEIDPDPDPIIRLDVSDCTGHVLTSLAFVQSRSWEDARKKMIDIHYKPDEKGLQIPTYKTRWHYTSDRITANPNTVNITENLLPREELTSIEITLNKQQDGSEFLDLGWSREVTLYYVPNAKINQELMQKLPSVCGVAFVRKSYFTKGIAIAHEGMIIDQRDLIHASQSAGETVRLDFLEYYFPEDGPFFDGVMIYKFEKLEFQFFRKILEYFKCNPK